jgi:autophagy-related protein 16
MIQELKDIHDDSVTSITACNDDNYFLTNSKDNTLKLIDARMFQVISTFEDENYINGYSVNQAAISTNGKFAVVGSLSGSIVAFDLESE